MSQLQSEPESLTRIHALDAHSMRTHSPETSHATGRVPIQVGAVRRFGPYSVLYEILRPVGDQSFLTRVLDAGEEVAYSGDKILVDPRD